MIDWLPLMIEPGLPDYHKCRNRTAGISFSLGTLTAGRRKLNHSWHL